MGKSSKNAAKDTAEKSSKKEKRAAAEALENPVSAKKQKREVIVDEKPKKKVVPEPKKKDIPEPKLKPKKVPETKPKTKKKMETSSSDDSSDDSSSEEEPVPKKIEAVPSTKNGVVGKKGKQEISSSEESSSDEEDVQLQSIHESCSPPHQPGKTTAGTSNNDSQSDGLRERKSFSSGSTTVIDFLDRVNNMLNRVELLHKTAKPKHDPTGDIGRCIKMVKERVPDLDAPSTFKLIKYFGKTTNRSLFWNVVDSDELFPLWFQDTMSN